ncbi:MAG: glycosyltransferase family 2 protein [Gammaproteobacteria bacterium]|nr:glycosyltransferase family 2 protein [Gammaproteobacteria bacterium]
MNITAIIIACNEAENIVAAIVSAQQICSEVIVVVDSKTSDNTAQLASGQGARVVHQPYLGDGPQKAFAVPMAGSDWILALDADERLEEDAVAAIEKLSLAEGDVDGYAFRRRNYVGDHWIQAAGFYPDRVVRLYHRQRAGYLPRKAHSRVEAKRVVELQCHLAHYTYRDYSHWIERINALSSRDAWAMYERGKGPSATAPLLHALTALLRKLIFKGGIFQGMDGQTVALTTAFHAYMKYMKLNELHRKRDRDAAIVDSGEEGK